jgi:hypothetical protein
VISDYRTSKVLAVNEIELGMAIPTIESRASKISRDEGNTYMGLIESWHRGSSDMSSMNMWESIWVSRSRY